MNEAGICGKNLGVHFFPNETFTLLQQGIYQSEDYAVYVNEKRDFAVIHPAPVMNYTDYIPRSTMLGLPDPKKNEDYFERRITELQACIATVKREPTEVIRILEVGASDGQFLRRAREAVRLAYLTGLEPSAAHREIAKSYDLNMVGDFAALQEERFDIICAFHTFEHFTDPLAELRTWQRHLKPHGLMLIEIPSLMDPLLSFFDITEFKKFYFQKQHPFIYSIPSITRLLKQEGYTVLKASPFQRYGLANHLHWLQYRKPGNDKKSADLFRDLDTAYRQAFENSQATDSAFIRFKY